MRSEYDVIVVGARVAGSAVAYELARGGCEVLLVDESLFPSGTLSAHNLYGNSLAMLREMGVLDRLLETGAPLYRRVYQNLDGAVVDGCCPGNEEESSCLCVRRQAFDAVLLDLARSHGRVRMLEGFSVIGVIRENGAVAGVIGQHRDGRAVSFSAKLVIGADGRLSSVRDMVGSACITSEPADIAYQVAYVTGLEQEGGPHAEIYRSNGVTAAVYPTDGGRHVVMVGYPLSESVWVSRFVSQPEAAFRALIDDRFKATTLAGRFRLAAFAGPIRGIHGFRNDWHQGMGRGWALVGDAFSFKDPAIGQGMHDALFGARMLAEILSDYHPALWRSHWDLLSAVYQSVMEKKLLSRFRVGCRLSRPETTGRESAEVFRMIGADPDATRTFLGSFNYFYEPEDVDREIGRLLSTANSLP